MALYSLMILANRYSELMVREEMVSQFGLEIAGPRNEVFRILSAKSIITSI